MQVVGRKQPPVAMQLEYGRLYGSCAGNMPAFRGITPPLLEIARRAGGHDVVPSRLAAAGPRNEMIECQIVACRRNTGS